MEHPQLGMYILATSMAVNTFLNWVFIFGNLGAPALGVQGAALATLIARVLEVVIVACHMARNRIFPGCGGDWSCGRKAAGPSISDVQWASGAE